MKIDDDSQELKEVVRKLGLTPKDYKYTSDLELANLVDIQEIKRREEIKKELYEGVEFEKRDLEEHIKVYGGLLTYKGEQVVIYIKDNTYKSIDDIKDTPAEGNKFHIGWCKTLEKMNQKNRFDRYVVTDRDDGKFEIDTAERKTYVSRLNVCKNCLEHIEHKGYDTSHSPQQKTQAVAEFNVKEFLSENESIVRYLKLPERRAETTPVDVRSPEYTIMASKLKNEKNYTCEKCGVYLGLIKNKGYLHAHHINGRKYDNKRQNLKILCVDCHIDGYHSGTHLIKVNAKAMQECREIKKQQNASSDSV